MTQSIPLVGEIFEQRYELLEELGAGGIGVVFKARQIEANRLVALKVMHSYIAEDEEFKQRFLREAQALSKLSHVNIVTVYHLGISQNGLPYLVMELIEGVSLRRVLSELTSLPGARVYKIMKQLCNALACIHQSGIIHRDLKPENIVVLNKPETDFVKIIDFGLVKMNTATGNEKLTSSGALLGSAKYMSPEQCQGKKAEVRSDIYALTICFYEMLSGKPPFSADTPIGLLYKHLKDEAPELRLATGQLPHSSIAAFVKKGMEKDPDKRFQSAEEMEKELSKLVDILERKSIAVSVVRSVILKFLAALVVFILAGVLTLFVLKPKAAERDAAEQRTAEQKTTDAQPQGATTQELIVGRAYLQHVVAREGLGSGKVRDLLDYRQYHTTQMALEASRAAVQVASQVSKARRSLLYNAEFYQGKDAYKLQLYAEAVRSFHDLINMDENKPPRGLDKGSISDAKAMAADAYLALGDKSKALSLAQHLLDSKFELSEEGAADVLHVLIESKRLESAKQLIKNVLGFPALYRCLEMSRMEKQPQLIEICLARAKHALSLPCWNSRARLADNLSLGTEECFIYLEQGKLSQARKLIESIYTNPDYQDFMLEKWADYSYKLVLAMRKAGLITEALELVDKGNDKHSQKALLKADLLVMSQRYEEARKLLNSNVMISDPETTKMKTAFSRIDDIESGKADYRKGLTAYDY